MKTALCHFVFVFAVFLGETLDEQKFHSAFFVGGGVPTARAGVVSPLGLVDALGLPPLRVPTRRLWTRPRPTTTTRLKGRPPGLGRARPGSLTPARQ